MTAAEVEQRQSRVDRIVDIATVILISLAALGTAWCSYQSARWSALQALNYSRANATRVEASSYADRANAHRIVDVLSFVDWERALNAHDPLAPFIRARFTRALKPAVDAWLKTDPLHNRQAPPTPFAMNAYHLEEDDKAREAQTRADKFVEEAVNANDTSDRYLFLTVLFAAASFLGGIAIKLRRPTHLVATCIGVVIFVFAITIMSRYPIR